MTIQQAFDLAMGHHRAGRFAEAEGIYRQILAQDPTQADALRLLGTAMFQAGRYAEAVGVLQRAVTAGAGSAEIFYYLGTSLWKCKRPGDAVGALEKSLALRPDSFAAHNSLGLALVAEGRVDEGIATLRRAVEINPKASEPLVNLGNALRSTARIDEALTCFRRAIDLNDDPLAWDNLLFTLNYLFAVDVTSIREEHERWFRRVVQPRVPLITPHANDRTVGKRLNVGFVSGDFNRHPVARFLMPVIENLDRAAVQVVCYSNTVEVDAQTEKFRTSADAWRQIAGIGDVHAAAMVRRDAIDILVDLSLHGEGNRLGVFALKPAPVQASWLGYAGTTGLHSVDWRITDPVMDPAGEEAFAEKAVRLGGCFWCYRPPDFAPGVSDLPAARNGYVTFGCLNNFAKVNHAVVREWAKVMAKVSDSRIVVHAPPGSHREKVVRILADAGVEAGRVRFVGFLPTDQYLREYGGIDVALDPFPFGGGTTTFDALWMGVPVATLAGKTPAGRGGASILKYLGRGEWVAGNFEEYGGIAVALATDLQRLAGTRAGLRAEMRRSALTDERAFAREMEKVLREMWRMYCAGTSTALSS